MWERVNDQYDLQDKILGKGTYGEVRLAICKETKKTVAIKLIKSAFETPYKARMVTREIEILKHFSKRKSNCFTTKLLAVLVPEDENANHIFLVMNYVENDL